MTLSSTAETLKTDYYELLGVAQNATVQEIKVGYIRMAKKCHPDSNSADADAAVKFQALAEAYEVLSDEEKRGNYDAFGMDGLGTFGEKRPKKEKKNHKDDVFGNFVDEEEFQDFHDRVFKQFATEFHEAGIRLDPDVAREWGCSKHGNLPTKEAFLELTFEEAVTGCSRKVPLNVVETCPWCNGCGSHFKHGKRKCKTCDGTGKDSYLITGGLPVRGVCPTCKGDKFTFTGRCYECEGKGKILWKKNYSVPIPAGVVDDQTLVIRIGETDVKMFVRVEDSEIFTRDGSDIGSHVTISIAQAVLGGSRKVDSIYDNVPMDCPVSEQERSDAVLQIPAGTSSHEEIRILGKGMKKLDPAVGYDGKVKEEGLREEENRDDVKGGGSSGESGKVSGEYGDHKVQIIIASPSTISEKQRTLMERYAELEMGREGTVNVRHGGQSRRSEEERKGHETAQRKGRLKN